MMHTLYKELIEKGKGIFTGVDENTEFIIDFCSAGDQYCLIGNKGIEVIDLIKFEGKN